MPGRATAAVAAAGMARATAAGSVWLPVAAHVMASAPAPAGLGEVVKAAAVAAACVLVLATAVDSGIRYVAVDAASTVDASAGPQHALATAQMPAHPSQQWTRCMTLMLPAASHSTARPPAWQTCCTPPPPHGLRHGTAASARRPTTCAGVQTPQAHLLTSRVAARVSAVAAAGDLTTCPQSRGK